jgi:choline-sulfatase
MAQSAINPAQPANLIVIMSDEHNPKVAGYAGHPLVHTPHLDKLAASGTWFRQCYTTSPVCVPARAGFATGKYIHQIGYWDNTDAFDGALPTWHSVLRDRGHRVDSIGKLHFLSADEDHGFSQEHVPMHILDRKGDLLGLVRDHLPKRGGAAKMAKLAGPGESTYTTYDRNIAARAQVWLREEAPKHTAKPWVLFVSFVAPHFPLTAPPEHFYRYWQQDIPMPRLYAREQRPTHPYLQDYRNSFCYDDYFQSPEDVKRALCGYFGLVSFLDENIGKLLAAVQDAGLAYNTRIAYTSDHGDNLGQRGLWGKSTMFEEIAGVPMLLAGPGVAAGRVVDTPVSHVDMFPTVLESAGVAFDAVRDGHPGQSLFGIGNGVKPERTVISEYHGMGSRSGAFALRHGRYKYVYYTHYAPQLFDLETDPHEERDIAADASFAPVLAECHARLLQVCDPAEVDQRARARQAQLIEANGGRDAIVARGDIGFTPAPGTAADFR